MHLKVATVEATGVQYVVDVSAQPVGTDDEPLEQFLLIISVRSGQLVVQCI